MAGLVDPRPTPQLEPAVARANVREPNQPVTIFMLPAPQTIPARARWSSGFLPAAKGFSRTDHVPGGTEVLVAAHGLPEHRTAVIRTFVSEAHLRHSVLRARTLPA